MERGPREENQVAIRVEGKEKENSGGDIMNIMMDIMMDMDGRMMIKDWAETIILMMVLSYKRSSSLLINVCHWVQKQFKFK